MNLSLNMPKMQLVMKKSWPYLLLKTIGFGAVHKRQPQSEVFVQCRHFSDKEEGFFNCGRPHF